MIPKSTAATPRNANAHQFRASMTTIFEPPVRVRIRGPLLPTPDGARGPRLGGGPGTRHEVSRSQMPLEPSVDLVPPPGQRGALLSPIGLADLPVPLLAELILEMGDLAEHLVDLAPLVGRDELAVDPQALPGDGQVDQ